MTYPISVFIMDVSDSSKEDMGEELSEYLQNLTSWITDWTKDITTLQIVHRSGDEVVVIADGYATAYTLAFYISRIWKFKDHKPYFGLSFGDIQTDLSSLDIETWIHPLMKQARYANDRLKLQTQDRVQFNFELDDFFNSRLEGYHLFRSQFESLLNTILKLQNDHINNQTAIQSFVCSLFLILDQQIKVSQYMGRSASTVSSHLKKGNCEGINGAFHEIVTALNSLQMDHESISEPNARMINEQLQNNIKYTVTNQLHHHFPINL